MVIDRPGYEGREIPSALAVSLRSGWAGRVGGRRQSCEDLAHPIAGDASLAGDVVKRRTRGLQVTDLVIRLGDLGVAGRADWAIGRDPGFLQALAPASK